MRYAHLFRVRQRPFMRWSGSWVTIGLCHQRTRRTGGDAPDRFLVSVPHEAFLLRKASRCWRVMMRLLPILM